MDALLFFLLAGAFVLFGGKFVRKITHRAEARRTQVKELARSRGWIIEDNLPDDLLYQIHGRNDGFDWEVVADTDSGGADPSSSTQWTCDTISYPELVGLIRTRKGYQLLQSMWGRAASGVIGAMVNVLGVPEPQHEEVLRTGNQLQPAASIVDENFVVFIRPDCGLERLLTPELERALTVWHESGAPQANSLSVDIGQTNLRVYCHYTLDAQYLEAFVNVGLAVAAALTKLSRQ
jgi:hypothetical protein